MSSFTVFIPRVFANIREDRIIKIFHDLDIGNVGKVDLVKKTNKQGKSFNMAFIHFDELYHSDSANEFHRDISEDKKSKVVYEDPWFWLVLPFEEKEQNSTTPQLNIPQLNTPQLNTPQLNTAQEFVPYSLGQGTMMMTAQGPMWYPAVNYMAPPPPMVPPQVAYGNRSSKQKSHPKKRINVPIAPCLSSNTPTPGETPTADNVLMDLVEKTKPTRSSEDQGQGVILDYGEIKVPTRRKRVKTMDTKPKASLINPLDLEEGQEEEN
jgi:hypothetical protein